MSPTAAYINSLIYGFPTEAYPTLPFPDEEHCQRGLGEVFSILSEMFQQTALEPETEKVLWEMVNIFHKLAKKADDALDLNVLQQRALQAEQDGSEIKSVSLEESIEQGEFLQDKRDCYEQLRGFADELFEVSTGKSWIPHHGSKVSHRKATASMLDSRDFIHAKHQQKNTVFIPSGTKIAIAGGKTHDHKRVWVFLDALKAKHPDMVLLHGGADGVEKIAALWAESRKVTHIVFRPDWNKYRKAAPFKRNTLMLEQMPTKVFVLCPDNGIHEQLIRESKRLGIPHCVHRVQLEQTKFGQ